MEEKERTEEGEGRKSRNGKMKRRGMEGVRLSIPLLILNLMFIPLVYLRSMLTNS